MACRAAEADVVGHRAFEEEIFLAHDGHLAVQAVRGHGADFVSVDEDPALARQVELRYQVDDRAFAAAGVADERNGLARLHGEGDVAQHRRLPGS